MKLLIGSDIHGSYKYLSLLISIFKKEKYDRLVLLGDLYYHGPRNPLPEGYDCQACISALNQIKDKLIAIQGNCDAEVDQTVSLFPLVKSAMMVTDGLSLFLTHGHIYGPQNLPAFDGNVVLFGHYHITHIENRNGLYLISPGSIALPKESSRHAYISYESRRFEILDLLDGTLIDSITL